MTKPFCTVPFVEGFSGYGSAFRNCCAADPQIESLPGQTFAEWNQDPRLQQFRQRMLTNQWQPECHRCQHQEQESGHSFRTAVNLASNYTDKNFGVWPSRWNLKFGNICNLACWTCDEQASSVIAQHKKSINILPVDFADPELQFQQDWPALEQDVLHSYDYHDMITLTLVGGEPMYNRTVAVFLQKLIDLGLAPRTRLEFHTNGTKFNEDLFTTQVWNYVCVFVSLDAVGIKAEWLRYGCRWDQIQRNIGFFKSWVDYVEVHCTVSILNINDLSAVNTFCKWHSLPLKLTLLTWPSYMSITKWPGTRESVVDCVDDQFDYYYNLIGTQANNDSKIQLKRYIEQYSTIRRDLADYDPKLAQIIGVSKH